MKSMMRKTTFREIKHSFSRYFAILAIIALGVGFFSGLKVTKKAMTESANQYLTENQLYDFRLLSTLGFEDEDVYKLAELDGVRDAEGAFCTDIIYITESGNDAVLKAHSITENVNKVVLVSGRMPLADNECVVDSNLFAVDSIGKKISLSSHNTQEDMEKLKYKSFIITGIVKSSYYIQFERGNTSIGNGKINGFIYLPKEAFNMDYLTEIFIKFDEDEKIYSAEYEDYIDNRQNEIEEYTDKLATKRYESIVKDATKELDAASDKLKEEEEKAESELKKAKNELNDAEKELIDGQKKIEEAFKNIESNRTLLNNQKKELQLAKKELELQRNTLDIVPVIPDELAKQIKDAQDRITYGEQELASAEQRLKEAEEELAQKQKELLEASEELEKGKQEYQDAEAEFQDKIKNAKQDIDDAQKDIDDIPKPETYVLDRNTNIGYVCFENDSSIVDGIANVFPVFFFLVAALVCMTTMNRMVEEQRTQIGVLKALGYSNMSIMGKYLFYSGSAAVTGCILGYFLGTKLFPLVIYNTYGIMYKMGPLLYVFDFQLILISMIVSILCSMGTTWFSCRFILKEVSAQLMRPKSPKAGKRVFMEYIPWIWKRLKFLQKVSVRNIVRYKKRLFMMILGISGCTALLVTGFGIKDSIANVALQQFQEIETYDIQAALQNGKNECKTNDISRLNQYIEDHNGTFLYASIHTMDLIRDNKTKAVNLVMVEDINSINEFINLHTKDNKSIQYPKVGEAVVCDKIAHTYHIKIGDEICLRNDSMQEIHVTVSAICENFVYNYIYIAKETYEDQIEEVVYKNLYINLPDEMDVHELSAEIMKNDEVTGVTVISDMKVRFSSMMKSLDYIVLVVLCCAAALAFIVLYNLNNINITERVREIATIKVLGFYRKETSQYVFRENIILTILGCGLGLILGKWLHSYVMNEINIDVVSFDIHVAPLSYLLSIVLTLAFTFIINRFMSNKLDKINMAESLKSVD